MQKGLPFRSFLAEDGQAVILVLVGILVIAIAGGAYYLGRQTTPKSQSQNPIVTSITSPSPKDTNPVPNGTEETANWKTYELSDARFKYPPQWELINSYKIVGNKGEFTLKCSGPILQNVQQKSTLLVVESVNIKTKSDGSWCWSGGSFKNAYQRTVTAVNSSKQISAFQWDPLGGLDKEVYSPTWSGYMIQTFSFNEFSKEKPEKNWHEFALIFENGKDSTAEPIFDQILSTFRFLPNNQ